MIDIRLALVLVGLAFGHFAPWYMGAALIFAVFCWIISARVCSWLLHRTTVPIDDAVIERLRETALRRQNELSERGRAVERNHAEA